MVAPAAHSDRTAQQRERMEIALNILKEMVFFLTAEMKILEIIVGLVNQQILCLKIRHFATTARTMDFIGAWLESLKQPMYPRNHYWHVASPD